MPPTPPVLRKGMPLGVRPKRWNVFNELKTPENGRSHHAAVWVDIDLQESTDWPATPPDALARHATHGATDAPLGCGTGCSPR